jgi:hypothetical protein
MLLNCPMNIRERACTVRWDMNPSYPLLHSSRFIRKPLVTCPVTRPSVYEASRL